MQYKRFWANLYKKRIFFISEKLIDFFLFIQISTHWWVKSRRIAFYSKLFFPKNWVYVKPRLLCERILLRFKRNKPTKQAVILISLIYQLLNETKQLKHTVKLIIFNQLYQIIGDVYVAFLT